MSESALWVDMPMMVTLPDDGGVVIEATWNMRKLKLRFTPEATDVLWACLEDWHNRRKIPPRKP
jgi:hypothetical protein